MWPLELKKNCPPELIIYIVGSKADLCHHRQVTPDLARLSLHNWFPPPRPPTPPPPPQPSTLSYIRPRFTSFPGIKSPPATPPATTPETPAYLDLPSNRSGLTRSKTAVPARPRAAVSSSLARSNTTAVSSRTPPSSRFSHYGSQGGWNDNGETSSNSINEDDEDAIDGESEEREWGLSKGMELFEVSAKDDLGKLYTLSLKCVPHFSLGRHPKPFQPFNFRHHRSQGRHRAGKRVEETGQCIFIECQHSSLGCPG